MENEKKEEKREKLKRGFAVMTPEEVSRIASMGGKAAHEAGTAHEWTKEAAREAGRKGGYVTAANKKAQRGGK